VNRNAVFAALLGSFASTATPQQPASPPQRPPWTLSEEEIREVVGHVRAGRDLTPKSWPNGAKVAVGLSFDLDNETGTLRDGLTSPALLSQGEYGSRAGLPRVLSLLEKHGIAASFFVPAVSAMLHPESMTAIAKSGRHEVGLHGWIHERNSQLDEATERDLLTRAHDHRGIGLQPQLLVGLLGRGGRREEQRQSEEDGAHRIPVLEAGGTVKRATAR